MESIEELYQNHSQTIYRFLLSHTRDANLAEELTQETFFQAMNSINRFEGKSSIVTWLCGIALNLWRKYAKERKKESTLIDVISETPLVSDESKTVVDWDAMQTLKLIHALPEPMREVLYLRLIGNLSFCQIGEIMEKSENWARVTFYRGKEKIIKEAHHHE